MVNCVELNKSGEKISGVYTIDPDGTGAFDVFCDQKTAGGGWTVFQKRLDGSVDFYRGWADYKRGFGNLNGEFWLGLDKIHRLTKTKSKLRVDLEDTTGKTAYAEYDMFAVTSVKANYQLSLGTYSGTVNKNALARLYMLFELPFITSLSSVQFLIRQILMKESKTVLDFLAHALSTCRMVNFSMLDKNLFFSFDR